MRLFSTLLVIVFMFCSFSDLEARKRRRKRRRKVPVSSTKRMGKPILREEEEVFSRELVYKQKYEKRYGGGLAFWGMNVDGIPDAADETANAYFFGVALGFRVDIMRNITLFPKFGYTFFDSIVDEEKVFTDHTKSLTFMILDLDVAYRYPYSKYLELFGGGGVHAFHRIYEVNYSTSSEDVGLTSSEKTTKFGPGILGKVVYNASREFALFASARVYGLNPTGKLALHGGFYYTFSITKRK
jgi:hypothetical protein